MPRQAPPPLSISAVERETRLSKDTLRVWERRYGFPTPSRDRHGDRLYAAEQVEKLRMISRLLDRGLRPGELVTIPLTELIERCDGGEPPSRAKRGDPSLSSAHEKLIESALDLLKSFDEVDLNASLSRALLRLGLQRFTMEVAAPMNERVGNAWAHGEILVSQEHLYTEQMQGLLRRSIGAIHPGSCSAQRPRVMLTTPPGESHQLGLLMAHACLAIEGTRCLYLGAEIPVGDIAQAACAQKVDVVGLSFSAALKLDAAGEMLADLRARIPIDIEIWAGGRLWTRARRRVPGVNYVTDLAEIPNLIAEYRDRRAPQAADS